MAAKQKVINLAMVGCGGMAGAHLNGYQELLQRGEKRFRIVAAVDAALDRARGFAERIEGFAGWPVNTYASVEQLLNSETDLDGADICSPHGLHHVLACELLAGGVNVLVEKPMAASTAEAQQMVAAATRAGKLLMVEMKWRFMPELLAARQAEIAAERDYITALGDYWIARVELEAAVGTRLEYDRGDH